MNLSASSMSESLVINLHSNGRFYDHFFSYTLKLILTNFKLFQLTDSFNLFLIMGLVLVSFNSGSKRFNLDIKVTYTIIRRT